MESLLFLVHRIPYPPNKGDKIRSYHLLRFLAQRYRVMLGAFVDDPADAAHVDVLRQWCADLCVVPLHPLRARLASLRGLLTGEALTLAYYRSRALARWVDATVAAQGIRKAVIFSSPMAQYLLSHTHIQTVADFCDVDSAKWTQYATQHRWPLSWLYRREGERLFEFERARAAACAATTLVTPAEVDLLAQRAPEIAPRLHAMGNGVDTQFFAPDAARVSPFDADEVPLVFTGAMDYWPNVDAVTWFVQEVLPRVRAQVSQVKFYIVGMNPTDDVRALEKSEGVVVTGRVDDVRPYVQHARAVVAPLRIARGVQNKVLEAMALARPVVVSEACAEGVGGQPGQDYRVARDAQDFAQQILALMDPRVGDVLGAAARARIVSDFDWEARLALLGTLLQASTVPANPVMNVASVRPSVPTALQEVH